MFAHRPMLTLLTNTLSLRTMRVIITATILRTILSIPAQIAFARVIRFSLTNSMHADVVTSSNTGFAAIADISLVTLAVEGTVSVFALSLRVTVV